MPGEGTSQPQSLSFQTSPSYLLVKVAAQAQARWRVMLAGAGIAPSHYGMLMALREIGPLGQQHLAGVLGIDPRNAVPVVDALVGRGLVHREVDPADRRRRVLSLTGVGREITAQFADLAAEADKDLLAPLTAAQRRSFGAILARMFAAGVVQPSDPGV